MNPFPTVHTRKQARLVACCAREYSLAIRREENAPDERTAWRLAAVSERTLRRLQLAQSGQPLPVPAPPRTARNRARAGLAALAEIGRVVARALTRAAALRKAQVAAAAARVARAAARVVRGALRRAVAAVVALLPRATPTSPCVTQEERYLPLHDMHVTVWVVRDAAGAIVSEYWDRDDAIRAATATTTTTTTTTTTEPVTMTATTHTNECHRAPPATLNGYPVRASRPRDGGGWVVLVERDTTICAWVTAVWTPSWGNEWTWGEYFNNEANAREHFRDR
jgi:hypothetical protein